MRVKFRAAVNAVLLAAGLLLCAHSAYELFRYPLQTHQSLAFFELLLGAGLLANRAGNLLVKRADGSRSRAAAWSVRLATFVVPVLAVGAAGNLHQRLKLEAGKAELGAAVDVVAGASVALEEQALASALTSAPSLRRVIVRVSAAGSVVETDAGSIDIDGSTLFVTLPQRLWGYFHNDEEVRPGGDRERYDQASKTYVDGWKLRCRRAEAGWQCEREKLEK